MFLNGLIVYGSDDMLLSDIALDASLVLEVAAFAEEYSLSLVGFSGDRSLCSQRCQWTEFLASAHDPNPEPVGPWREIAAKHRINKVMLMADPPTISGVRLLLDERLRGAASLTQSQGTMLEVLPPGSSKGAGMRLMLQHLGVACEEVLALGDAENDIEMLAMAGVGVAMGNASPGAKRAASHATAANDDDGAALAIQFHLLEARGVRPGGAYSAYCQDEFTEGGGG